jgi:hypothetical protein
MDALNKFGLIFGVAIAVLSAVFSYVYKERYKTLVTDIYQPGNDELRSQLGNARTEITELEKEIDIHKTRAEERERLLTEYKEQNQRLPDFAKLTSLISNNHTEVIKELATLGKVIAGRGRK